MKARILTANVGWKLLSLAVAFGLWLVISGARELTTSLSVPVQYRNIPKELEISSDIAERVHLVLRGPSPLLSRLNAQSLPLVIDLNEVDKPGLRTFTLGRGNVNLPTGVTLERVIPAQIQLKLEARISKEVPVEAHAEGSEVPLQVTPARLLIVGPKSRVEKLEKVHTDPVNAEALAAGPVKATAYSGDPQVNFVAAPVVTVERQTMKNGAPGKN